MNHKVTTANKRSRLFVLYAVFLAVTTLAILCEEHKLELPVKTANYGYTTSVGWDIASVGYVAMFPTSSTCFMSLDGCAKIFNHGPVAQRCSKTLFLIFWVIGPLLQAYLVEMVLGLARTRRKMRRVGARAICGLYVFAIAALTVYEVAEWVTWPSFVKNSPDPTQYDP